MPQQKALQSTVSNFQNLLPWTDRDGRCQRETDQDTQNKSFGIRLAISETAEAHLLLHPNDSILILLNFWITFVIPVNTTYSNNHI